MQDDLSTRSILHTLPPPIPSIPEPAILEGSRVCDLAGLHGRWANPLCWAARIFADSLSAEDGGQGTLVGVWL
jgi:hypothetical protein